MSQGLIEYGKRALRILGQDVDENVQLDDIVHKLENLSGNYNASSSEQEIVETMAILINCFKTRDCVPLNIELYLGNLEDQVSFSEHWD